MTAYRRTPAAPLRTTPTTTNRSYKQVRACVEHAFLRDCRLRGDGVHHALLGIARLHNSALVG